VLPTQSICLTVPVVPPSEYDELTAMRQRIEAQAIDDTTPTEPSSPDTA
jgi:beta-glucosidase